MPSFKPSVVTANLLRSGDVVYLGADEAWVRDIEDAVVAHNEDDLAVMEQAGQRASDGQVVISVYAMPVEIVSGKAKPFSVREIIRAAHGPTI